MSFIDALSFCLSLLGIYGLVLNFRYLLPCYIIPVLSVLLTEARQLLDNAEAISAIPSESEIRMHFTLCGGVCIVVYPSSHTVMQIIEPICDDAHGEQSGPGDIPETASCYLARQPDIQTLLPFWPDWSHQIKPRGTLYHLSRLRCLLLSDSC